MAKIQTIKDKENKVIYPQTHTEAIFTNDGTVLQDQIDLYLTTDELGSVEDVDTPVELQSNKVTTINEVSTDATYPSAAAVYKAIIAYSDAGVKFIIPESGVKPDVGETAAIYLIPNEATLENNVYEEWMYINNAWEIIGSTQVDLSNYYNKTEADEKYAKLEKYKDTAMILGEAGASNTGLYSVAIGNGVQVTGNLSFAMGKETEALADCCYAAGRNVIAKGKGSHAEGYYTDAYGQYQHVQGKMNIHDTEGIYAHIVGNGNWNEDESEQIKSNAHTLDWGGNAWFSGEVYVGSTSGTNKDSGSKKLATEEYIDNKVATALYITDLQDYEEVDN